MSSTPHIGPWRTPTEGHLTPDANGDLKTDYTRWRLVDEEGRQTWRYLESDAENNEWPQSVADKYHLGLPTVFNPHTLDRNSNIDGAYRVFQSYQRPRRH
jgi:lanosterol synthase